MKSIEKSVEFLGICPSEEDEILKHIESCGRRCYKSEHKIDYENRSFEKFYTMLLNHGHVSAIEHSNIVVEFSCDTVDQLETLFSSFLGSALTQMSFFRVMPLEADCTLTVSGNIRAWNEFFERKFWFCLYKETGEFLAEKYPIVFAKIPGYLEKCLEERAAVPEVEEDREAVGDVTMRIVSKEEQENSLSVYEQFDIPIFTFAVYTDRGISHEIVRHRVLSFSQESTRYVNYKNRGIEFVHWDVPEELLGQYVDTLDHIEEMYIKLIEAGVKPQFARNILPNATKTEIAISGRLSGWDHFIDLRSSSAAHPDIQFVSNCISEALYGTP